MQHPFHGNIGNGGDDDASTIESKSAGGDGRSVSDGFALPRAVTAGDELESLCRAEMSGGGDGATTLGFPPTCLPVVRIMGGNHCCVDCGDEERNNLRYASIGYGTILCKECAHRHVTMSAEESNIKSLMEDLWSLRSTLTILEGSNLNMLDYVKHKPRWRPSKGDKSISENDSQDVLAFKQIYLSKAAATYRKDLSKRVDDSFYRRLTVMRNEDAISEKRAHHLSEPSSHLEPFRHIFEQNNVSAEEIPGFFGDKAPDSNQKAGAVGNARDRVQVEGARRKGRGSSMMTLMKHESPSMDMIRERINKRRGMNSSISSSMLRHSSRSMMERDGRAQGAGPAEASPLADTGSGSGVNDVSKIRAGYPRPRQRPPQGPRQRLPRGYGRKSSDYSVGLVGEVGDASIQEHDEQTQYSMGDRSYQWMVSQRILPRAQKEDDNQMMGMYSSRALDQPLGMYRRSGNDGVGDGWQDQLAARRGSANR